MRISDWSSDVCASDLTDDRGRTRPRIPLAVGHGLDCPRAGRRDGGDPAHAARAADRYARAYRDFAAADLGRGGARAQPRLSRQGRADQRARSEEHTSELQSLMRLSYAVFCLKKKNNI